MRDVRTKLKEREKEPQREMVGAEEREEKEEERGGNGWPGMAKKKRERKGGARHGQHPVTRSQTLQHSHVSEAPALNSIVWITATDIAGDPHKMNSLVNSRSFPDTPDERRFRRRAIHHAHPFLPFGATCIVHKDTYRRTALARRDGIFPSKAPVAELGVCMGGYQSDIPWGLFILYYQHGYGSAAPRLYPGECCSFWMEGQAGAPVS
jgi:hypothetical protein